ncbi:hypothetical protein A3D14_00580 [Candidatus Saccharibacteria bacterium RIFCSPHIGHO2_02_FULL_47_12]|nr:MAG: hypothetical protein A3D14_00580 [Candidatus Saccharibacteria bacterium RIFCSPHIGHO2_02_FULL_47_12]
MDPTVVKIEHLYKDFKLPHERKNSLKERVLHVGRKSSYEMLHALKDIDLEIKKGEFFGIVGRNGSGKSTLLKILGGIYQPTKGRVTINGTLTPFIELGIGFNPELTGRENVYLNGAILGLTRKEIVKKYQEIVDFAELERFMDQKLKNYSSGMQVRLAFSIAIQAHNDILLIDEVLAVGDTSFQRKCYQVFKEIKQSGKTVVFVTHDMGAVQAYCDRAMMIQDSEIVAIGQPRTIAQTYERANSSLAAQSSGEKLERPKDPDIRIESIKLLNGTKESKQFSVAEDITAEVKIKVKSPQEVQINAFVLKADGTYLGGINSTKHLKQFTPSKGEHTLRCTFKAGQLIRGDYNLGVGIYTPGYVPDIIDVIDRGYSRDLPRFSIIDASLYQDGQFYIAGSWTELN